MSFSGQSNPPWQRNSLGNAGQAQPSMQNLQSQMGVPPNTGLNYQNQSMFHQNMNMTQQNQNVSFSQLQGNINQMPPAPTPLFSQAVSYPTARGLNPIAFSNNSNSNNPQQQQQSSNNQTQSQNQGNSNYNAIGTVTKLHNDCGFVDDEVFFHKSACKGAIPKVGDRVLVEAAFNQNSPFKWNATRIQIVPTATPTIQRNQPPPLMGTATKGGSGYNAVPPPNEYANQFGRTQNQRRISPSSRRSPDRHAQRRDSRNRDDDEIERKRRRDDRDREKERRDREKREHSMEKRDRSPIRRSSPKRRRTRAIPRYMVQIPKVLLTMRDADVLELRRRYTNLYIPSDFFCTQIKWSEAFPPNNPFSLQRPCSFHIMHKTVESPKENESIIDPPDADYLFSAKVMLMGSPPMAEIYQKCLYDEKDRDDDRDFVHPTRLINFLVGIRGKNETMAIGGAWSPSLDGKKPQEDPTVLIRTAIRTCKSLTGIDLSGCTQWYRFVELYYRRAETSHKNRLIPARVETVVIFLPDINSCMPTRIEWDNMHRIYKINLERVLNQENHSDVGNSSFLSTALPLVGGSPNLSNSDTANKSTVLETELSKGVNSSSSTLILASNSNDEAATEKDENVKRESTHFSELDPKVMKIHELRDELIARNLSSNGLKPQLIARLSKALHAEKIEANSKMDDENDESEIDKDEGEDIENCDENDRDNEEHTEVDMTDIVVLDEYDSTKSQEDKDLKKEPVKVLDEKERQQLERRYQLPETPHIIVHPSKTAKAGKFNCTVMSLSVLLDYRPEDTKERSFEVSLFAELFNEMLMRDFGFNIYKEVMMMPEKEKDDNKKKDEKKSTENDNEKLKDNENEIEKGRERLISDSEKSEKKSSKDRDRDRDRKLSKQRNYDDDTEDDNYSIKSTDKKKKQKTIVSKPDLLLSFIYFDTTHCGYIFEKDVEDLLYILGLKLSRAQVRKVLTKIISRDALYYRKLTDKGKDEETETTAKDTEEKDRCTIVEVHQLAKGNKIFLPVFKESSSNDELVVKQMNKNSTENSENKNDRTTGMILYNGGLLDIEKLLDQMKRSEKAREETEQILIDLRKQNSDLQIANTKSNSKIKDLQADLKSVNRKLNDAEQNITSLNKKYNDYYSILSSIYDKVSPVFSKSERNSKSDSSRDKDKEREKDKERDREREKDRDKEDTKDSIKIEIKKDDDSRK